MIPRRRPRATPAAIATKGKTTVLKWTAFSIDGPETTDVEYHVSEQDVLTGVRTDSFQTRRVRYGRKSEMKLSAPKWPDAKVRIATTREAPFAALAKLVDEFMKLNELFDKDK